MQNRITIEGNIGCGKSTLLDSLRGYKDYEIILEPLEVYIDFHGYNLLTEQQDPKKRMACQIAIADSLYERVASARGPNVLVERRAGSMDIFLDFYENEYPEFEFTILRNHARVHELIKTKAKNEKTIYLRCSPGTTLKCIKRRGRQGEENIDENFIGNPRFRADRKTRVRSGRRKPWVRRSQGRRGAFNSLIIS